MTKSLSDLFDFFFDFEFLAFHRRKPHKIYGRPFGLFFDNVVKIPMSGVEFA
ncbi:MAG: hypothetical protein NW206_09770 [Hyphomonadaceae bacterium]|nr:hypothetical protein [Hyphomonadaceae bacterium]